MRDATTVLEIIRDCIAITISTGKPDATETGTSGLGRGRWKRATTAPRWRPTSLHAGFCGSPGVRSPRATRQDADRRDDHEVTSFTFLGYEFRPRLAKSRTGHHFGSFLPAVSTDAMKAMGREIRSWHLARRSDKSLDDLARMFNNIVQGWINYYGRFYKSLLISFLADRINPHLVRWAMRKFKHLHRWPAKARKRIAQIATQYRSMFVHWRHGALPAGSTTGAV